MATKESLAALNRLWPRSTSMFLLFIGVALAVVSFTAVLVMQQLPWSVATAADLEASFSAFRATGALLTKAAGNGYVTAANGEDPGVFVAASAMGRLTGATSPYVGLRILMAFLIALPLVWLPTAVARIFRRARAGYALVLLPAVMWLVNEGTVLVGTEYGLSDIGDPARVSALDGLPASLAFLSLTLLLLFSTYRMTTPRLLAASGLIVILAAAGNLTKSFSGIGIAIAIGVLWWLNAQGRRRWLLAVGASAAGVALTVLIQFAAIAAIDGNRASLTGSGTRVSSTSMWESAYRGLSYPEPVTGAPSTFHVPWSLTTVQEDVLASDPAAGRGTAAYQRIIEQKYLDAVAGRWTDAARLYLAKFLYAVKHFGAMIAFIVVGYVIALMRRSPKRRLLGASLVIALPTLVVGLASAVVFMPVLGAFAEISAALGMLTAVALGALAWSLTSMPAHVRATERSRLSRRMPAPYADTDGATDISVIVPTRNGENVIAATVTALAEKLDSDCEIIVVENGSSDRTDAVLHELAQEWSSSARLVVSHSGPGLGEALRTGVLESTGRWLLLTADDLPFGFTDYDRFRALPADVIVAIGSKAHPDSQVTRSRLRTVQSRIFRFLRAALLQSRIGDSQGTIWVEGRWARAFALASRETGLMWTTELVLAAEQQGMKIVEVPVSLSDAHETGSSRFRIGDAWRSVVGFTRLAIYKDDYVNEVWTRSPSDQGEVADVR